MIESISLTEPPERRLDVDTRQSGPVCVELPGQSDSHWVKRPIQEVVILVDPDSEQEPTTAPLRREGRTEDPSGPKQQKHLPRCNVTHL